MNEATDFKRWTAKCKEVLVKELMRGQTALAEAARLHDLRSSEIEKWVDEAEAGMENALRANPGDVSEQYERKLEELHSAYGEAMLQVKALKNCTAISAWTRTDPLGSSGDGDKVSICQLCRWFDMPHARSITRPSSRPHGACAIGGPDQGAH